MDLAQILNAPEVLDFGGRSLPIRQLTLAQWAELQSWLKRAVPSPLTQALRTLAEAESFGFPVPDGARKQLLDHAQEAAKTWPPPVGSSRWLAAVDSAPGGSENFLRFAARKGGTELTEAEAAGLAEHATPGEWAELIRISYLGDPPAPKAATSPAPAGTVTTPSPATNTPTNGAGLSTN